MTQIKCIYLRNCLQQEAKYPIMFIKIFYRHCAHQLGVIDKLAGAGVRQGENHSRSRGSEAGFKQALNISENFSREGI